MQGDPNRTARGFEALVGPRRWRSLVAAGHGLNFRRGAYLLRQGEQDDFVLALSRGRVKVLAATEDGSEVVLSFRGAGDLVGEMALTSGVRAATVEAIERCTAHRITALRFRAFLAEHAAQQVFSDYLVAKLSETVPYQLQQVHFGPLRRTARLLLEVLALADDDGDPPQRIPLSQEAIATALGMARSTVADRIAELRRVGALAPGPRLVVADRGVLAEVAGVIT